jgi:hypothetical protein
VSNINKKIYASIEAWRMRPIDGGQPYVAKLGRMKLDKLAEWITTTQSRSAGRTERQLRSSTAIIFRFGCRRHLPRMEFSEATPAKQGS